MIFQAIMSSTSLANPYYVSLDKSWWNQAKDLWNKYGGGTDYERHMLRQLYDLRDDARKPTINTELWTRLIMNINILGGGIQGMSNKDVVCVREESPEEATIYQHFVSSLNSLEKHYMKHYLTQIRDLWPSWYRNPPWKSQVPLTLTFLLNKFD